MVFVAGLQSYFVSILPQMYIVSGKMIFFNNSSITLQQRSLLPTSLPAKHRKMEQQPYPDREIQFRNLEENLSKVSMNFPSMKLIIATPTRSETYSPVSENANLNVRTLLCQVQNVQYSSLQAEPCTLHLKTKQPNDTVQFSSVSAEVVITLLQDLLDEGCPKIRFFPALRVTPGDGRNNFLLGMLLLLSGEQFAKDAADVNALDDHDYYNAFGLLTEEEAEQYRLLHDY